jgi:hypothetical protein
MRESFTAEQLWKAIDSIVANKRLGSPSRLAIMAGLHPTALNKSKRKQGKNWHWLSMRSLSMILAAAHVTQEEFAKMMENGNE